MLNLLDDALTNKTYLYCEYNYIPYDIKHRNAIGQVDKFVNRPAISSLLSNCGLYNKIEYHYRKTKCKWYLVMQFTDKNITAIASNKRLIISNNNEIKTTN